MQLLKIAPTPDEAYELCDKHKIDCDDVVFDSDVRNVTVGENVSLAENLEATTPICNDEDCAYDSLTEDEEEAFTPSIGNLSSFEITPNYVSSLFHYKRNKN